MKLSCEPDHEFSKPLPLKAMRGVPAAESAWKFLGTWRRGLRLLALLVVLLFFIKGPFNGKISDPIVQQLITLDGAWTCPGTNCAAAQTSMWQQFATIINSRPDTAPPLEATSPSGCGPVSTGPSFGEEDCSTCECVQLRHIADSLANASSSQCQIPSVLNVLNDHADLVESLQQSQHRVGQLRAAAPAANTLDSGSCSDCDRVQCSAGIPAGPRCDTEVCLPVCLQLSELFASTAGSGTAECGADAAAEMMSLTATYQRRSREFEECAPCCASVAGVSASPCTAGCETAPGVPRCSEATCQEMTAFYRDLSRVYGECPSEMPPGLRGAVVGASMQEGALSMLQHPQATNLSALQLPPETVNCVRNLTRQFPVEKGNATFNGSVCYTSSLATKDKLNHALEMMAKFRRGAPDHTTLTIVLVALVLVLIRQAGHHYKNGQSTLLMTHVEEERYTDEYGVAYEAMHPEAFELKATSEGEPPTQADGKDPSDAPAAATVRTARRLVPGYERHVKAFVPLKDDFVRASRTYVSADGGNMATIPELQELSRHPDVHVLASSGGGGGGGGSSSSNPLRSDFAEADELSAHAQEVLCSGSLAINHLVWRRSMLRVCMMTLMISILVQIDHFTTQIRPGADDGGEKTSGDDMSDPLAVVADYADKICNTVCSMQSQLSSSSIMSVGIPLPSPCDELCGKMSAMIGNTAGTTGSCEIDGQPDPASESLQASYDSVDETLTMHYKMDLQKSIGGIFKLLASCWALHAYFRAEREWTQIRVSSTLVARGWVVLFAAPLLVSFVPWYNALDFDQEFAEVDLIHTMLGGIKGVNYKIKLAVATYAGHLLVSTNAVRFSV